jgi:lipopolysaccharide transport system ATP-binding protein
MSSKNLAVSVRGLSKSYQISHRSAGPTTVGEALVHKFRNPFASVKREMFQALQNLSFDVCAGDVVGIIGRNGAGKSTLLKILSRITEPTQGRIDLYGRVGSLLEVGTGFHPELTGRENIFLNGAILGMSRREIALQFEAIVDFSDTERFLDTPVKRYSSGMYIRLAFAVAAHLNPEILIVDEVLAVGDAEFQKKCLGKMQSVAREEGRTVLFVSHNMSAVQSLCTKGLLLHQGCLQHFGDVATCIDLYTHEGRASSETVLAGMTHCHPDVTIDTISVNGSVICEAIVNADTPNLHVEVRGKLASRKRLDLELWLQDSADRTLAFFSAGHENGKTPMLEAGEFQLCRNIRLPTRMHRGEYFVSLALTDHNVCGWADFPRCLRLQVEGYTTKTGKQIEYRENKGFLSLEGVA